MTMSGEMPGNRRPMTLHRLREMHAAGEKIAMLTCYDASFASLAAVNALKAAQTYRTLVACELVAAVRAVRMRGDQDRDRDHGPALHRVLELCGALDPAVVDRDLTPDIEVAGTLLEALAGPL